MGTFNCADSSKADHGMQDLTQQDEATQGIHATSKTIPSSQTNSQGGPLPTAPAPLVPKMVRVRNPADFPIHMMQEVQNDPDTQIAVVNMNVSMVGQQIVQVFAQIEEGSATNVVINDRRLITALGLMNGNNNVICPQAHIFRMDETFIIINHQLRLSVNNSHIVVGELVPARNAYLDWLAHRVERFPTRPPFEAEAELIARNTNRSYVHVLQEIGHYWELEQGCDFAHYRENRLLYLGEDMAYLDAMEKPRGFLMPPDWDDWKYFPEY